MLVTYAPDFADQLADAVSTLEPDNPIVKALADYVTLRAQVRACWAAR